MKNLTTEEFCRKFGACKPGAKFALKYKTMRECYDALLRGEAGKDSRKWAIWTICRPDVITRQELVLFSCRCVREVWDLLTDERSRKAVETAEAWAHGKATLDELEETENAANAAACAAYAAYDAANAASNAAYASRSAYAAAYDAANAAAYAATNAARTAANAIYAAAYATNAAYAAAETRQMEFLREMGNPFEESTKDGEK